jgi:hypothetical protein
VQREHTVHRIYATQIAQGYLANFRKPLIYIAIHPSASKAHKI